MLLGNHSLSKGLFIREEMKGSHRTFAYDTNFFFSFFFSAFFGGLSGVGGKWFCFLLRSDFSVTVCLLVE